MLNGTPTDAMTVLKPTIKDQKVSDGPIPRNPLNSWNNPPTISLLNYPAPKHQPRHISDHPLIFWGGPNSACGVCFSLNKSTSYQSLHLWILSGRSKNLKFTWNVLAKPARRIQEASASLLPCAGGAASLSTISLALSLAPSVAHSLSLTLLERGEKKPSRHFPPLSPGLQLLTVHAHRECREKFPAVLTAARDLKHRLFALWVCLIHRLINC